MPPHVITGKSGRDRLRSGRARGGQQLSRAGHDVTVFERADRIGAAALRHPGIQDGKAPHRPAPRPNGGGGNEVPHRRKRGRRHHRRRASVELRRRRAGGRSYRLARPADPGRQLDGIHQAMEYLPLANRVQQGDPVLDEHGEPPITAKGKRVVIIGGGDTGADCLGNRAPPGAASVHQFEIMARPPETRAESTPWPTYPLMFRVASAHEEGGERVFSVNTERFVGAQGKVTGPGPRGCVLRRQIRKGRRHRLRPRRRSGPSRNGIRRARTARSADRSRGETGPNAEMSRARQGIRHLGPRCVRRRRHGSRPVTDRLGDRRRPRCRGRRRSYPPRWADDDAPAPRPPSAPDDDAPGVIGPR